MTLNTDLQNALIQMQASSLEANWNIPNTVTPLTAEERAHLFSHPVAHVVIPSRVPQDSYIQSFVQQLQLGVLTDCFMPSETNNND